MFPPPRKRHFRPAQAQQGHSIQGWKCGSEPLRFAFVRSLSRCMKEEMAPSGVEGGMGEVLAPKWAATITHNATMQMLNAWAHHFAEQAPFCFEKAANRTPCDWTVITLTFMCLTLQHVAVLSRAIARHAWIDEADRSNCCLDPLSFSLFSMRLVLGLAVKLSLPRRSTPTLWR